MSEAGRALIERLQDPALYDHPVTGFELVETHISWVLLTGPKAYKLKKPLRFPFLDFSTLERRREACLDELRLNRHFAPELYEAVLPITEHEGRLALGGPGPVLDHLLRMRQFERDDSLDALADRDRITPGIIDQLAESLAETHARAARLEDEAAPWGRAEEVWLWVDENFETLRQLLVRAEDRARLERLAVWTRAERARVAPLIDARRAAGLVRECHGDLHLGNIVLLGGRPTPFDCIEFNPALRWLDPMSDVAFLLMDLRDRGLTRLAWRFLSVYLQHGGDYAGLGVLRYYGVYRALVRAKVAALRLSQTEGSSPEAASVRAELSGHLQLAERIAGDRRALLLCTHGLSGSGKSHLAERLAGRLGALQIRSDVERKRLFGLAAAQRSGSELDAGIYTPEASDRTYRRVADCAAAALTAGYPAIADATFLRRAERRRFLELAEAHGAACLLLDLQAPKALLEARVAAREVLGRDASEAGPTVLHRQLESREALDETERARALRIDASRWDAAEQVLLGIRERLPDFEMPEPDRLPALEAHAEGLTPGA